jgi:hypothetical protein
MANFIGERCNSLSLENELGTILFGNFVVGLRCRALVFCYLIRRRKNPAAWR